MKTTTATNGTAAGAASAFAAALPSTSALTAKPVAAEAITGDLTTAVTASFVGERSADLVVVLADPQALTLGSDSALLTPADVLRPALEAAVAVLGAGVLGDARVEDAGALLADPDTAVFAVGGRGTPTGWVGIRIRENGTVSDSVTASTASDRSVVGKLGRISSVEMALTVEIGRTRMSIRDLLSLEPGAVIELDRAAGAPADVLLNGRLIAHGEIVVVDQDYAVRITKILDVAEGLS